MERVWKYERRTRDYMKMYRNLADLIEINPDMKEQINQKLLEDNRKTVKESRQKNISASVMEGFLAHATMTYVSHRNVAQIDGPFLRDTFLRKK